ncbi:PLP-dependent aminotransferase family protein [Beijerinckia sp. L45]|uniref:aminotransferase-like domain-containing protein n=1 Tax=Beijerinckia sp. L45 TaxID=1641855 RepID=UPI001FEED8DC|nr:PLP-dependent aminotransferase family protein [Beijerinckia sp. L45]
MRLLTTKCSPWVSTARDIDLALTRHVGGPLFIQLRDHIRTLVNRGTFAPGDRLPPVRALAGHLKVNQITVARAYAELAVLGIAKGRRGGGTFICKPGLQDGPIRSPSVAGAYRPLLADRLYELSRAPGVISFTSNYPLVGADVIEEFRSCLRLAVNRDLEGCFQYEPPIGRASTRREISRFLERRDMRVDSENIVVTSGAQQAIDLAVRALIRPGDVAVVERPGYYGVFNALREASAQILEVPLEGGGMDLGALEDLLNRHTVRLIYVNPTIQNPTGQTMSESKRRALLALARRYDVAIIEDDHASEWCPPDRRVPSIAALAGPDDLVFFAYSFGKIILPGQRLGFLAVPPRLRHAVLNCRAANDLHGAAVLQEALAYFLEKGHYEALIDHARASYAERMDVLHAKLIETLPPGVAVEKPLGGLSLWITLPDHADSSELYYRAVQRGVAFVPGEIFFVSKPDRQAIRVSFGLVPEAQFFEGVDRLCAVVRDLLSPRRERSLIYT